MESIEKFLTILAWSVYFVSPILIVLAATIVALGQIAGRIESWEKFDALYWSFITATTVGYGDIRPTRKRTKGISILIAFLGVIFTGFIVAIAVNAASVVIEEDIATDVIERIRADISEDH